MTRFKRVLMCALLTAVCCFTTFSTVAFAENNLVPYEPGGRTGVSTSPSQANSASDDVHDYAGELFEHTTIVKDPGVSSVVQTISQVASVFLTFIVGVLPVLLTIQILVDIVCILLKPAALLMSRFPFQLNADEAIMVTGIQFVGGSGEGDARATNIEKVDLKGENPVLFYVKRRFIAILFAIIMCMLLGTGLMFDIVFWIANHVISWIAGIL